MTTITLQKPYDPHNALNFELPAHLEASEPPEARGLARDAVRLMVSYTSDDHIQHTHFRHLPNYLRAGDVVVINTSATMNAALPAKRADGHRLVVHLSTKLADGKWIVEVRQPTQNSTKPFSMAIAGETLTLPNGASVMLHRPYKANQTRLWVASLNVQSDFQAYLAQHGAPIRYSYVNDAWPIDTYQTVYANEVGSAEMPSAGRAFTQNIITQMVAAGVQVVPLVLHTGVASLEKHEAPYEEYYRVPQVTAQVINNAHADNRRVVAVGTTVVRALETVIDDCGDIHAGEGWTDLVITPDRPITSVNAMLTGLHEPQATHLAMLEALAGRDHIAKTYQAALAGQYLWHEFGDLHLIVRD